jgi:hypothetical protein
MSLIDDTPKLAAVADIPTLADFVDAFRRGDGRACDAPRAVLSPLVIDRLERCAREFERESHKPVERRRHVGAVITSASAEEANAVCDYFVESLRLRLVEMDARTFDGLSDEDAEPVLRTLADSAAHIVAVHGIDAGTDPRVLAAIEWADVDVFVVGFADAGAIFSSAVRRTLGHRVDLLDPTANTGRPRFPSFF